ncbi:MAG TPA: biopolymer transporter ExbD [Ideonella sp.]|nr:biopolymer transporter ExbD [Ideonella sp.]
MAFGRLERARLPQPMSDINMTPLIDVMMVLLVIFMITAPLMSSSLKLDLPKAQGGRPNEAPSFLEVALTADGKLYLADQAIELPALRERAEQAARRDAATEVQLRADTQVPYGRVAELIGLMQAAGLSRIGFLVSPAPPPAAAPTGAAAPAR